MDSLPPFRPLQAFLALILLAIFCLAATNGGGASRLWWLAVPIAAVAAGFLQPRTGDDYDDDPLDIRRIDDD